MNACVLETWNSTYEAILSYVFTNSWRFISGWDSLGRTLGNSIYELMKDKLVIKKRSVKNIGKSLKWFLKIVKIVIKMH